MEQIEELEGSNSRLTEEVQTLKGEIENKQTNEESLQERISELDCELSMHQTTVHGGPKNGATDS